MKILIQNVYCSLISISFNGALNERNFLDHWKHAVSNQSKTINKKIRQLTFRKKK